MMNTQKTHKRKISSVASVFGRQLKQNRDTSTATVVQMFSDSNHLSPKKQDIRDVMLRKVDVR